MKNFVNREMLPALLLRSALAIVFLYAAIASFKNPMDWVGYLPDMVTERVADPTVILKLFSVLEIIVAALLVSGVYVRYVALLAALLLGGIVVSNVQLFVITFRDFALMLAALALAALPAKR